MIFFGISVLAGIFTVLAPCILPLLPVVIGASETGGRYISRRALVVVGSLSVSVIVFTLLLKASTLLIDIPQVFWSWFSGAVLILVGLAIVFPSLWARVPLVNRLSLASNKLVGTGYQKKSYAGDIAIGAALGPVFTTCSPTYLFIIATVLPATFAEGVTYLFGFVLGLSVSLLLIAYFGQQLINKALGHLQTAGRVKQVFGVLIVLVGIAILTGYDKKIETFILDSGYGATIQFENALIERFAPESSVEESAMLNGEYETITLAGGCFWCTEAYFQEEEGIIDAVSGYAGGDESEASYLLVSKGTTNHREAVQITYDPKILSTEEVLDIYWSHIDPTNEQGQFADTGFQYTTAIYYQNDEQKRIARDSKERLEASGVFDALIATEVLPFASFYKAEEYHQDYYKKAADHYERYKKASGRAGFVEETWAKDAAIQFLESKQTTSMDTNDAYNYTDEEIAKLLKNLDPLAYHVVAENGTESPFNNAYWDNKADGIYVDVVTGKPLFSSTHKYDSGTGWPSFWRTIDDNSVTMHEDNSLSTTRTEIRSEAGHVGHVFNDGPAEEGGRRFCTNSASLKFIPKEEMVKEGYEQYLHLFDQSA
ncbi:peptide-methionine (S)-S-oxide reductase MsrA [Patescibacteria group bacterium]|nr:peptide-methionine (S)-S-oxide reductase MsrA [Patescibacteria group bacterium]MBU1500690.1 peptide-methionine (S)-S-oxide reductase MsrA [Patescibacteria group bacterium]MBU2080757.1 peptide-methionine (S)-S-oxide reductase MsrA [Patescibacteria group bacterium]MBU2123862.1 peptide-methionine (S)-S-oxide reductase MsrA [Patescibacteria group bacterium]MBU2194847.1 peptide-methionine (S)-S-oxide reductase MsrA [Patescibacteria group bacterium]